MAAKVPSKAKKTPSKRGVNARPVFSHFVKKTRNLKKGELVVHTMQDALEGLSKKSIRKSPRTQAHIKTRKAFAVAGRLSAFFLFAFTTIVASALVINTVDAATFQSPTQAAPLGNIPITIWNRAASSGTQTSSAIAIDGDGSSASPSPHYGLSVGSGSLTLPTNANLFYGNIFKGNADGSSNLLLLQTASVSKFRVDTAGNTAIAGTLSVAGNTALGPLSGYPFQSVMSWASDHTGYYQGIGYQKNDGTNKKLQMWWIDNVLETNVNNVLNIASPGHTFDGVAPNSGRTIGASISSTGNSYFNGGNVGIGTTNPGAKFAVSNAGNEGIELVPAVVPGVDLIQAFKRSAGTYDALRLDAAEYRFTIAGTEKVRIQPNGNVGIGEVSPSYKLHIGSGIANIVNGISEPSDENGFRLKFIDNGGVANDVGIGISGAVGTESLWINNPPYGDTRFMFGTNGEKVTFKSSGNVGIGTTNPNRALHVLSNTSNAEIDIQSVGTSGDGTQRHWSQYVERTDNSFRIWGTGVSGDNRLTILAGGNVGIGAVNPGAKLEVAGQIKITGGTPGLNKVLTSDATGLATWSDPTSAYDPIACFGPKYVGRTSPVFGDVGAGGGVTGYRRANALCEAAHGAGAHVCSVAEMLNTVKCWTGALVTEPNGTGFWISGGPPGYTSPAKDCDGWTSSSGTAYGRWWQTNSTSGGVAWLSTCNLSKPLSCCK